MSTAIVLPPLKQWAQQHLSSILKATTDVSFNEAFDAFISKNASISLNGKSVSREAYKAQLQAEQFDEAGADVQFGGAVDVPSSTIESGVVGLFYTATIAENLRIRDAPIENVITSSLNLVIEEDKSLTPPHFPAGIHGFFGKSPVSAYGRRVSVVNQILVNARQN
ncbi:unnamed protein product [Mycena citricolor]|uniref:Uncharacterized protein n=1 Tax=Mycena citricolor TaxID=2018698 RepID=A0AAD2H9F7_9AGAR|nr:unnamed protein product [Mycena citricolor]